MTPTRKGAAKSSREGQLPVAGGHLAYDVAGKGSPVVFLHALIADRRMWDREFQKYAAGHTVVRYDLRGLGASPPAKAPYSEIEDLDRLIDHLQLGPVTLVGCSGGGKTALDFAVEHPLKVQALLLVAPGVSGFDGSSDPEGQADYDADGARLKPVFEAWGAGRKEEATRRLREYWCSQQSGKNLELVQRMIEENAEEIFTEKSASQAKGLDPPALLRIRHIRAPTIVLSGDHDEPTCGWIARRVAHEIAHAELIPVSRADHLVNLSRPDVFDSALQRLLA